MFLKEMEWVGLYWIDLTQDRERCRDVWDTRWRSWLRHCATSRKVAGSIPGGVIGIFP